MDSSMKQLFAVVVALVVMVLGLAFFGHSPPQASAETPSEQIEVCFMDGVADITFRFPATRYARVETLLPDLRREVVWEGSSGSGGFLATQRVLMQQQATDLLLVWSAAPLTPADVTAAITTALDGDAAAITLEDLGQGCAQLLTNPRAEPQLGIFPRPQ